MLIDTVRLWILDTNTYIVAADESASHCVVIDVPPDALGLRQHLDQLGVTPDAVLLTHGHLDHAGGVAEFCRLYDDDISVWINAEDEPQLIDPRPWLGELSQMIGDDLPDLRPPILNYTTDGQLLQIADLSIEVRHTPGHTLGSTCFLIGNKHGDKHIFTGDHLFAGGIGRTDLRGGNLNTLLTTMRDKVLSLDDGVEVHPGHGPSTTVGIERQTNPFLVGV